MGEGGLFSLVSSPSSLRMLNRWKKFFIEEEGGRRGQRPSRRRGGRRKEEGCTARGPVLRAAPRLAASLNPNSILWRAVPTTAL